MKSNLKICHLSDTHGKHWDIKEKVPLCDVLIVSGDVSMSGEEHLVKSFFNWLMTRTNATYKIFVAGNHDKCFDPKFVGGEDLPSWLKDVLYKYLANDNNFFLNSAECTIEGVKFWGSPITPWFHGDSWAWNRRRGPEIKEIWDKIPSDTDVLVTHGPPMYTLDYTLIDKLYVGCEDLRNKIKQVKPLLHLFGHIHEGYGYDHDEYTHYFNSSICDLYYNPDRSPFLINANFEDRKVGIEEYHENK